MEIYTLIFSTLTCMAIILAFSNRLARLGLIALVILFGIDAFYAFFVGADYVRLALDAVVVGMVVVDLFNNWRNPQKNMTDFGAIGAGAMFVGVGTYSFLQNGSFVFVALGIILILIGLWRFVRKKV